jgi:hypothetical protein
LNAPPGISPEARFFVNAGRGKIPFHEARPDMTNKRTENHAADLLRGAAGLSLAAVMYLMPGAAPARAAGPAPLARYGVVVYSDLCVERKSGDIGGQRISLHRFAEDDSVIYEFTAGSLSWPVVATDVVIDDRTGVLTFSVQETPDAPARTVIGRFSERGRTLTLDGGYCADASMPIVLPRVSDFGRALPACQACPAPAPSAVPADSPPAAAQQPAGHDSAPTLEQQELLQQRERNTPVPVSPAAAPPQ